MGAPFAPANILTAISYTSNYFHDGSWGLGHLWSLSIEEQFYLLWPLTLLIFFSSFFSSRRKILLWAIASGPPLRIVFWLLWGHRGLEHPFPVVMDALAMGCLPAIVRPALDRYHAPLVSRRLLLVAAATLLLPLLQFLSHPLDLVLGLTALHIGIALCVDHAIRQKYAVLNAAPVLWLGVMSYSLYPWQQPFLNRNSSARWTTFR